MQQKVTAPLIAGAVVVAVVLIFFLARTFMAPPPHNPDKPKFPSFIDPATGKPKAGVRGSGETTPTGRPAGPGGPQGGAGAPGGAGQGQ